MNNIKSKLETFQIDYLKLQVELEEQEIKWSNLIEHPTIKNQYIIKSDVYEFAKNFSVYFREDEAIIKFSLPYFLHGHNYCSTPTDSFKEAGQLILDLVGINIMFAEILELEFGGFEKINGVTGNYFNNIIGINDYHLEKSTPYMRMFGKKKLNLHYKVYDAVANAKKKKTFTMGNYPNEGLIKHELKFTNTSPYFDSIFYVDLFEPLSFHIDELSEELIRHRNSLKFKSSEKLSLKDTHIAGILYATLKEYERGNNTQTIVKTAFDIIESSGLSCSQKSKRRKSIQELEKSYDGLIF